LHTNTDPPHDWHAFGIKHINHGIARITEGIVTKGEGSWMLYDDGRRMLDFTSGIGVTNLGVLAYLNICEVYSKHIHQGMLIPKSARQPPTSVCNLSILKCDLTPLVASWFH
jgi:acetylornithine/succinyldiaminopimelate/putrescine aminotransferase